MIDQTTPDHPTAIGYAVIEEREGEYATPHPDRYALVTDAFTAADQSDLTPEQARQHAHGVAAMIAHHLNRRDAEYDDVTWHVVALVPVDAADSGCSCGMADRGAPGHDGH